MGRLTGCLGLLAKITAIALAVVLILSLPLSLGLHDLGRVLASPSTVANLVVAKVVDSGMLREVVREWIRSGELFAQQGTEGLDMAQALSNLEPAEVDTIAEILLPPNWAGDQITSGLERLYAWVDNDQITPSLVIDLRPLKGSLLTGGAERLVETIVDSWPTCSLDQVNQMNATAASTGEAPLLYCEPPEPFRSVLTLTASDAIFEMVRQMPDELPLPGQSGANPTADPAGIMAFKEQIRMVRVLAQWGWILPLSLLGLIMALVIRSWRSLSRWWGIPLLLGGLLSFLLLIVGIAVARRGLATALATGSMPGTAGRLIQLVGSGLVSEVSRRLFWHSLVLTFGAGLVLALGLFVGRKKPSPTGLVVPAFPAPAALQPPGEPPPARAAEPPRTTPAASGDDKKPSGMFG